ALTALFAGIQDSWDKKPAASAAQIVQPAAVAAIPAAAPQPDASNTGLLTPGDGKTPDIPEGAAQWVSDKSVLLFFGNGITVANDFPFSAVQEDGEDMLTVSKDGDDVLM